MISCYYCSHRCPDTLRGRICPACGRRLPGAAALVALGREPRKDSLGGLIIWAWVFLLLGAGSLVLHGLLSRGNPVQVSAALATFHYTALTCRLTGGMIGLTLIGANIGSSRWHGLVVLVALVLTHWVLLPRHG